MKKKHRMPGAIPPIILNMLHEEWKPTQGYSSFASVWGEDDDEYSVERRQVPSWYFFYRSSMDANNNGLCATEVDYLFHLSEYEGLIREVGHGWAVNEHCQHAVVDFCSEVYDAYAKLEKRLAMAKNEQRTFR